MTAAEVELIDLRDKQEFGAHRCTVSERASCGTERLVLGAWSGFGLQRHG